MTLVNGEDYANLHERALQFMGAFSSAQFAIDTILTVYLSSILPELGPELQRQFLKRVRDDQRLPLLEAFCREINYPEDLSNFKRVYNRAKQLRDKLGHSLAIVGPVYSWDKPPEVGVAYATSGNSDLVPSPLLPSTFTRMQADCEWLSQHIWRAGYVAGKMNFVNPGGAPFEPPVPPLLPQAGEDSPR